jgi:PAS domain-containing protein
VPLLSRLFLLVAIALLPAIAIQTYNEIDLRRARQVEVQDQALGLAKLAAAEQQQIVQGIRQALIALSELPAIKAKDIQACNAYLLSVKQRYPGFIFFIVTDMDGISHCNTGNGEPMTSAGRAYFANALRTGAFTVGEFAIGRQSGCRILHFALPYYGDDARMGGIIVASLSLDWLADFIARKGVPPGAALTITDRNGTVLARYPDNERFAGKRMPDAIYATVNHTGAADTRDLDGVERIVGSSTLEPDSGGLLVTFGLDKTQAFTEIRARTERGIFLIILSTSLVLMFTWLGARQFIHRPLGHLVDAANQWRLGDYGRRVTIRDKRSEIARVGDAFNTMAEALENRERELLEAKRRAEEAAVRIITVFESTTDSVLLVDRDWRISYANERAKVQLAEGSDLIGVDLWQAFPDTVDTNIYSQIRAAMSDQQPARFEAFFRQRNVWYEVNAFPSSQGLRSTFETSPSTSVPWKHAT